MNELFKYIALLRTNLKVSEGEIKVLLVSTDWQELYVPFSEFTHQTTYTVIGVKLTVDNNYKLISKQNIKPLKYYGGRLFSPKHSAAFYKNKNKDNLDTGVKSHEEVFLKKGIKDYVMIVIEILDKWSIYKFAIYSAIQRLTYEMYIEILKQSPDDLEFALEAIEYEEATGENVLTML